MVVENVPGAGGLRGVERANALAAAGDPVLLLSTPTTHILLPARLGASALPGSRFAPFAGLGAAPNVLLVSPALGVHCVPELVARAKQQRLTYASAGTGQTIHVCSAFFCRLAGIEMAHKPYDGGSATAYPDFIAGRVPVYFDSLLGCREHVESGEAIPLAVSARERSPLLPQVPTLAECGYPAHALEVWLGVFAANVMPEPPVPREEELRDSLRALGLRGGPLGADAFAAQVDDSRAGWTMALASIG